MELDNLDFLNDEVLELLIASEPYLGAKAQIEAIWRAMYRYACHLDSEGQHARYDYMMEAVLALQPIVETKV